MALIVIWCHGWLIENRLVYGSCGIVDKCRGSLSLDEQLNVLTGGLSCRLHTSFPSPTC